MAVHGSILPFPSSKTADGGTLPAGATGSSGNEDVLILKLGGNGDVTWQRRYGDSNSDSAFSIQQTVDGG